MTMAFRVIGLFLMAFAAHAQAQIDPVEGDLRAACAAGDAQACKDEGLRLFRSSPEFGAQAEARDFFARACDPGHALACQNLGFMWRDPLNGCWTWTGR